MRKQNKLAVVGIGNELCKDDGFGLLAIRELERSKFNLGTLIEGSTMGLSLIPLFFEYENLIFLDILKIDDTPGSIYVIPLNKLSFKKFNHISFHDIGIEDAYVRAKMLGANADAYLIGIVPEDYVGFGEVSGTLRSKMKFFIQEVYKLSKIILNLEKEN